MQVLIALLLRHQRTLDRRPSKADLLLHGPHTKPSIANIDLWGFHVADIFSEHAQSRHNFGTPVLECLCDACFRFQVPRALWHNLGGQKNKKEIG